jgi:hypothetical protein
LYKNELYAKKVYKKLTIMSISEKIYNLYKNEGIIHITIRASPKVEGYSESQLVFAVKNLQNLFFKNLDEITNILGINNYADMHKVKGGICFEYNTASHAVWNYNKLKKSNFLKKLSKAFPDISFAITFPWKVWTKDISISYF